jgi:FSR family fosmidomycin resistance protein-like MFS transporter
MLVFLPLLGLVLNGTSSVLYGTVPELAPKGNTGRTFALFYTESSAPAALRQSLTGQSPTIPAS